MERRQNPRYPVETAGSLWIEGMPSGVYAVTVLDVSKSGLRVRCPTALPNRTRVRVKCLGARVSGEVRYSRHIGQHEFHLGVEVDSAAVGAQSERREMDLTLLFR